METRQEIIDADTSTGPMAVLHTRPVDDGPWKRVGIFFDAPGIRDATEAFCRRLAAEGFEVVVPDLYHREERLFHVTPAKRDADPSIVDRMREFMGTLTDDGIQQDMDDAAASVGWTDGPIGVIGFCLGARAVHRAMTRDPQRFVAGSMFHPSFLTDEPDPPYLSVDRLTGRLHIGIGTADQVQSIEMHQRYFDAVENSGNVEVKIFDGADHGFTWPGYPSYHQEASDSCFAATLDLFGDEL
jgi:carboxymethylenebutenolidase